MSNVTIVPGLQFAPTGDGPWRMFVFSGLGGDMIGQPLRFDRKPRLSHIYTVVAAKFFYDSIVQRGMPADCGVTNEIRIVNHGDMLVHQTLGGYVMHNASFWVEATQGADDAEPKAVPMVFPRRSFFHNDQSWGHPWHHHHEYPDPYEQLAADGLRMVIQETGTMFNVALATSIIQAMGKMIRAGGAIEPCAHLFMNAGGELACDLSEKKGER